MPKLILLRHGQSIYNAEGRFTGTTDVELTALGREQARQAAEKLKNIPLGAAYTSERIRAKETLSIVLDALLLTIPVVIAHELNEQDFGDLEGVVKSEAEKLFGADKIFEWRRAFQSSPPRGERFIAVQTRVAAYYKAMIEPQLRSSKNVIVVAHSNSLRALGIYLMNLGTSEMPNFELENAQPYCIAFSEKLDVKKASYL